MQLELVWANEKPAVNLSTPILVFEKVRNINHIILQANTANIVHCVSNQQYQSGRYQSKPLANGGLKLKNPRFRKAVDNRQSSSRAKDH